MVQVLQTDEVMLTALALLLVVGVLITVQRALSQDQASLAAWGAGDLL